MGASATMSVLTAAAAVANSKKHHEEEEKAKKPIPIKKHQFRGDHFARSDKIGLLQQYMKQFGGTDKQLNRKDFVDLVHSVQIKYDFEEQVKALLDGIYNYFKDEKLMSSRTDKNGKLHLQGKGK